MQQIVQILIGTTSDLRQSADIAFLITTELKTMCGLAFRGPNLQTVGMGSYTCIRDGWTLPHEIAHIFGARHNREAYGKEEESDKHVNFGFLMKPPENSGLRTIMA